MTRITVLAGFAFLLTSFAAAQQGSTLQILDAERFVGRTAGETVYQEFSGDVRMKHGNVLIDCDRAVRNMTDAQVELIGNVVITQDTLVLKTERGMYDERSRRAWTNNGVYLNDGHVTLTADIGEYFTQRKLADFISRITIEDSTSRITAQRMRYDRNSGRIDAMDDVLIRFKNEHAVIQGDSVVHYPDENTSLFPLNPVFWQLDSSTVRRDSVTGRTDSIRVDTLSIVSEHMAAYRDSSDRFITSGDVEIVRGGMSARCETALLNRSENHIILQQDPILWYDANQVTGDSIRIDLEDQELRSLHVVGNAFSVSSSAPSPNDTLRPPGRYDQTKGNRILMLFEDGSPMQIRVEQSAISLYYLYDERALNGVRRESGDLIIIDFLDGKAEEIRTIGGVEGTYFPEQFVTGSESTYNLDGFNWRTDRPAQPVLPAGAFAPVQR